MRGQAPCRAAAPAEPQPLPSRSPCPAAALPWPAHPTLGTDSAGGGQQASATGLGQVKVSQAAHKSAVSSPALGRSPLGALCPSLLLSCRRREAVSAAWCQLLQKVSAAAGEFGLATACLRDTLEAFAALVCAACGAISP